MSYGGDFAMDLISPIKNTKNLGEQAYETLRDSIITLKLEPGQNIYENEIAALLEISRTPIRDAFHSLISEQLIEVLPQRTKIVSRISEQKVKESAFIRMSLERSAFKLVASNWDQSEKYQKAERQIQRILDEQEEALEAQDIDQFFQLHEAFHNSILQLTGNETLLQFISRVRGNLDRFRYLARREFVLTGHSVDEHRELLTFLKNRDEQKVEQLVDHHMGELDEELAGLREKYPTYFTD